MSLPSRFLTSLDPFQGRIGHDVVVLRALRLAIVLCSALIPAYGVLLHHAGLADPWALRVGWVAAGLIILAGTYRSRRVQGWARSLLTAYLCGLVVWVGALAVLHSLRPEIALGYLFTYAATGAYLAFAAERAGALAALMSLGAGVSVAVTLAVAEPGTDPALFVVSNVATGLVLFLPSYARLRDRLERAEAERTLAETERLARIGSWSYDAGSGARWWSAGMYRLVGLTPDGGDPALLFDYVPPAERAEMEEMERRLLAGEVQEVDHTFPLRRADGAMRENRTIVRMTRSADGASGRLVGVSIDVTAQAEHERALEAARRDAEAAAALKSSILANMSHEIRTPLTAVIGFARLLREELDGEHDDLVEPIEIGGERLLETLNSVLDFARIEAGQVSIELEPVDLTAEVRRLASLFGPHAQADGLTLRTAAPEAPVYALASKDEVGRVLTNLVSNAIKFTHDGAVTVRLTAEAEAAVLVVEDTGQGIAPEFLPDLFEPFRQESTGNARRHEGSGLGLAITQRMVAAMGGTIGVRSIQGEGTAFTVRLPLAEAPEAEAPERRPHLGTAPEAAWIARPDRAESPAPAPATASARARAGA